MKFGGKIQGGFRGGLKYQGGWIGAAIGAVAGLAGSAMSSSSAKSASKREAALRDREIKIAERQDARGQMLFDEYTQTYLPRERELVSSAFSDETSPEAAAARATTDVRAASQRAQETQLRSARRLGINPTSGAYAAMDNDRSLRDAAMEVSAKDIARRTARNDNFQRQHSVLSLGRNLTSQAGALTGSAGQIIGNAADAAGRRTDQANMLAGQAGDALGRSIVGLGQAIDARLGGGSASYSTGFGNSETIGLADAGNITVRRPVIYED